MAGIIQSILSAVAPRLATARAVESAKRDLIRGAREAFKSAATNRLNANWDYHSGDLNTVLRSKLTTMRKRSRWLSYNNPHAASALSTLTNYVIGAGMQPQSAVRRMVYVKDESGEDRLEAKELDAWNDYVDDLFEQWTHHIDMTCTPYNPTTWLDLQKIVMRRWFEDGEVLIRTREVKGWPTVPFAVEVLLPEWLDTSITQDRDTKNDVYMGVEVDARARAVAYHFKTADRDGSTLAGGKTIRVPASDIIHLFVRHQPRQLRGIPPMAAVMEKFYHLDEYVDFELISAKIAACFGAFITTPQGDTGQVISNTDGGTQVKDAEGNILTTVEPGIIGHLPPGYGVTFAQPQKPGTTFGMFTEYHQRSLGAGLEYGLSYESITRDTSKSNFAGGRLGQLMDFQTFRSLQLFFSTGLVRQIRRRWLDAAVASAAVTAPGYYTTPGAEFWQRIDVLTSGWPWGINPSQEVNASRDSMRAGITTLADEAAYLGRDWKQQLRLKAKIDREAKRLGIVIDSDAAQAKAGKTQNSSTPVDDDAAKNKTATT